MIEVNRSTIERTILVALNTGSVSKEETEEHLNELEELAATAGADAIIKVVQHRASIDPAFYIGKGKAIQLAELVESNNIDLIIFDDDLSAIQLRNLERLINKKIIDRSGLILDIFASRAKTREAKTQVELAQLQYMLPRLTRAWTHLSKQYGGIGTKGPGETQIETDRRIIRTRISHLKEKLSKIESQRETQSSGRKNFVTLSIVGYTNAGKSTLFNLLTQAHVLAEDKLFATLDSTTRLLELGKNQKVLISDTVGFIRKLPHHLVASFKSTLDDVRDADIILHVIDLSHPYYREHIEVVDETLKELGCDKKTQIKVFNKADLVVDKSIFDFILNKFSESILISALRGININSLYTKLNSIIEETFVQEEIDIEISKSKIASMIYSLAEVLSANYDDNKIHITYKTNRENSNKIKSMIQG